MLRVGLTGELGSGKSTVADLLAQRGAVVLSSDEMGRALMQPGQPVFQAIVQKFGPSILTLDGNVDRRALAALAFDPAHPRVGELNALVHPAVFAAQELRLSEIAREDPRAVVVIESALLFTTQHAGEQGWQERFDRILLVTAPDAVKIDRFIHRTAGERPLSPAERASLTADAERRLAAQRIPPEAAARCTLIENTGDLSQLEARTEEVFRSLVTLADAVQD